MKLITMLKKFIKSKDYNKLLETQDEDQFYTNLFTKHPSWNTKEPNADETARWDIIKSFLTTYYNNVPLNILDLGCGRGWLSNLLSDYGAVIGIEPVKNVVKYAKKLFPDIKFIQGTMAELFNLNLQNHFDLIVCSEVIEHIENENKENFVYNISRLLKKDGACIVSTPRGEIQAEWLKDSKNTQPVEEWISEDQLKDLFVKHKFERKNIERIALQGKSSNKLFDVYQVAYFKKH